MKEKQETWKSLSKDEIIRHMQMWESAKVTLSDIRHQYISSKSPLNEYPLPSNVFLYTIGEKASISLDHNTYCVERFGMFHASKGVILAILPDSSLEYYMIYYKAEAPLTKKRESQMLSKHSNPFPHSYGFLPRDPIYYAKELQRMYIRWQNPNQLDRFYEKVTFYQVVYEIYQELLQGDMVFFQIDILASAKNYLDKNYNKGISIQELSNLFGVSSGHFRSTFKERYGYSPKEYMTKLRIEDAKYYLTHYDVKLKEVAMRTGFYDEYQLSRLFKKYEKMTPLSYKAKYTWNPFDLSIEHSPLFLHNEECQVSLNKLKEEGVNMMLNQIGNKTRLAVAISFLLLLSACSQPDANKANSSDTSTSTSATTQEATKEKESTRTMKADNGEIEIPQNPKRILATLMEGDLVAFGVTPQAIMDVGIDLEKTPYYEEIKDLPIISADDPEAIMEVEPDVIITYSEENAEKFSKIAPTLVISASGMDIRERTRFIGELLNQQEKAEELIKELDDKVASLREKIKQNNLSDKTVTIMEGVGTKGEVWLTTSGRGSIPLYDLLGFQMPEKVKEEITGDDGNWLDEWLQVSMEVLPEYVGDYVFFSDQIPLTDIGLSDSQVWNSIPAVSQNHVFMTSFPYFFPQDIYSISKQLTYIDEVLFPEK